MTVTAIVYHIEHLIFVTFALTIHIFPFLAVYRLSYYTIGHRIEMLTFLLNNDNCNLTKKRYRSSTLIVIAI